MRNLLFHIALLPLIVSCSGNDEEVQEEARKSIDIEERVAFQPSPVDSILVSIRPSVQNFSLQGNDGGTIEGVNGTRIFVPRDAFIDETGEVVDGQVDIQIVESSTLADMITSRLQTTSEEGILESAGMIFIDATANGKPVKLSVGSELSVSFSSAQQGSDFQYFQGRVDDQTGNMVWLERDHDEFDEESNYLIPLPLELLYPNGRPWPYWGGEGDEAADWYWYFDSTKYNFSDEKFANTLIATKEFKDRVRIISGMTGWISNMKNLDWHLMTYEQRKDLEYDYIIDPTIIDFYFSLPDRDLTQIDNDTRSWLVNFINENRTGYEKIWQFQDEQYGSNEWWEWKDGKWIEEILGYWSFDSTRYYGKVKIIDPRGVNLNSENAYDQLISKGVSRSEASFMLEYNFKRNELIEGIEKENEAIEEKKRLDEFVNKVVFKVDKLGWVNADRFYDDPDAEEVDLIVNAGNNFNHIDFSLILKDRGVRLTAHKEGNGKYLFTKEGRYSKLPVGGEAMIVGLSYLEGKPHMVIHEFTLQKSQEIELALQETSIEDIKSQLAELN